MPYREAFTNDELVEALAEVIREKGSRTDLVKKLNLSPESGMKKVTTALQALKKQGVAVPDFRKFRESRSLTPEQVSRYNEQLEEKQCPSKPEAPSESTRGASSTSSSVS